MKIHHRVTEDTEGHFSRRTYDIVRAAIEVHRQLGPGLLESTYEACLGRELSLRGISHQKQVPLPVKYRGLQVDCGYRSDLVVGGAIIVEVKAVRTVLPVYRAQVLTYLKLTGYHVGLLITSMWKYFETASTGSSMDDDTSVSSVPLW
jgi:GxxExxY protein